MDSIDRGQDEDGHRWYTHPDGTTAMSVTTVLDFLDEDTTGLDYWKKKHNGNGDSAWWQHLFWFSGPRGTLAHYQVLNEYADEELWGKEERESLDKMLEGEPLDTETREDWMNNRVPVDEREIIYSVFKNKGLVEDRATFDEFFEDVSLLDVCYSDVEWFKEQFDALAEEIGIDHESVVTVERFLLDGELGFGGQCDLVYENPDGETVLADLKTGSFRQTHRLQSVAYSKAVERADDIDVDDIDRLEVISIHPDKKHCVVHSHDEPAYVADTDVDYETANWFTDPYGNWEYESLEDMWETFDGLVEVAHENVDTPE